MKSERSPVASVLARAAMASMISTILSSCTATMGPQLSAASPNFASSAALTSVGAEASSADASSAGLADAEVSVATQSAATASKAEATSSVAQPQRSDISAQAVALTPSSPAVETANDVRSAASSFRPDAGLVDKKKQTFLSSFFANAPNSSPASSAGATASRGQAPAIGRPSEAAEASKPIIQLASVEKPLRASAASAPIFNSDALPGVRQSALFEIKRKSGLDDDSDIDIHEDVEGGSVQLASAGGMARLAPNGLLTQRESVDTACLKPALVNMLRGAERHFGKRLVVTSGFRSPSYNRKVNGAKKSMHMYCAAADIQMAGVSKFELARYFRALSNRGGVGTYCSHESVHVDVGPERDWNWRCSRRG